MRLYISHRRARNHRENDVVDRIVSYYRKYFESRVRIIRSDEFEAERHSYETLLPLVASSTVLLAVIGTEWTNVKNRDGSRCLDDPYDQIRLEISIAFDLGIPVIPVLADGARPPKLIELPHRLRPLARVPPSEIFAESFFGDFRRLERRVRSLGRPSLFGAAKETLDRLTKSKAIDVAAVWASNSDFSGYPRSDLETTERSDLLRTILREDDSDNNASLKQIRRPEEVTQMASPPLSPHSANRWALYIKVATVFSAIAATSYFLVKGFSLLDWVLGLVGVSEGAAPLPPSISAKSVGAKPVQCSLFGPSEIAPNRQARIQLFLHTLESVVEATKLAKSIAPNAELKNRRTLSCIISDGAEVTIKVIAEGLSVSGESTLPLIWREQTDHLDFWICAPEDAAGKEFHVHVLIFVDGEAKGELGFSIGCEVEKADFKSQLNSTQAVRYDKVFLSYSSRDREKVALVAQAYSAIKQSFFMDVLGLTSGERWKRELYRNIDDSDLFILLWSRSARKSKWVKKEAERARVLCEANGRPRFIPMPIDGPPPADPWDDFADIQVADPIYYALAGSLIEKSPNDNGV